MRTFFTVFYEQGLIIRCFIRCRFHLNKYPYSLKKPDLKYYGPQTLQVFVGSNCRNYDKSRCIPNNECQCRRWITGLIQSLSFQDKHDFEAFIVAKKPSNLQNIVD